MPHTDFIPQNPTAFVVWFTKFILHLQALSPKYELCFDKVDALLKDYDWVYYWAWMRSDIKEQEKRLNSFFHATVNGYKAEGAIGLPLHAVSGGLGYLPDNVMPGIRERILEVVECIKSQKNIYTKEDGSLLGILTPEEAGWSEEDYTPDMKFKQLPDYSLEVDFRKFGLDAIRVQYRYLRGDWRFGGFLEKSPDILKINPLVSGRSIQIEIRAVFWDDNRNFGNWSPVYRLVISP